MEANPRDPAVLEESRANARISPAAERAGQLARTRVRYGILALLFVGVVINYLDIHPETDRKIRTLSCRNGAHFELFEYTAPDQNKHMPKSSDYGGHHVTFYVDDMDAAIAYLKSKGVYLFGEKRNGYGAEAGKESTFVHFKTSWGLVFELISYPYGRAYEQEKPAMWRPPRSV